MILCTKNVITIRLIPHAQSFQFLFQQTVWKVHFSLPKFSSVHESRLLEIETVKLRSHLHAAVKNTN